MLILLLLFEGVIVCLVIDVSGVFVLYLEIDFVYVKMGVYGKFVLFDVLFVDYDCVEIYCLLIVDLKFVCQWCVDKFCCVGLIEGCKWMYKDVC